MSTPSQTQVWRERGPHCFGLNGLLWLEDLGWESSADTIALTVETTGGRGCAVAGVGIWGSSEFTLCCGEVYFRYQLVFAHVSSSFSVHSPSRLRYFQGKLSQLIGVPHLASNLRLGDSIMVKKTLFLFFIFYCFF
jgi:hypothetical protein